LELTHYLTIARRWWLTLLLAAGFAGVIGYLVIDRVPKTFEARADVVVGPVASDFGTIRAARAHVQAFAQLITTPAVLNGTIETLGLSLSAPELQRRVSVSAETATRVVTITVQSGHATTAAAIANELVSQLNGYAGSDQSPPDGEATMVEPASPPTVAIAPQVTLVVGMAALTGLLGAVLLVILVESLNDTVRDSRDLVRTSQAKFLGAVGVRPNSAAPSAESAVPESRMAVSFRILFAKIAHAEGDHPFGSLLVVGSQPQDGTGEIAAGVADALQRAGRRVTLIDANDDEREVSRRLGLEQRRGLAELMGEGPEVLDHVLHETVNGMRVLPAGLARQTPLIDAQRARTVLEHLRRHADTLVINAAPPHRSASSLMWARLAEATVLIAYRDRTRRENVRRAVESLRLVGAHLIGSVLLEKGRSSSRRRPTQPEPVVPGTARL
jgi:capsular polysaccharide biosynthesis protein